MIFWFFRLISVYNTITIYYTMNIVSVINTLNKGERMKEQTFDRIVAINVDVQNDFIPGGSLAVEEGDEVVTPLNQINEFVRQNDGIVAFTGDQHPEITDHFNIWPVHCVAGTEGAALHADLEVTPEDILINKGMGQTDGYSGFEGVADDGQTLETLITPQGRERVAVLIGGLATDYCVRATALDALKVDAGEGSLTVFLMRDAIRAVNINPNDGRDAIDEMEAAGAIVVETVDILTGKALELAQ